jgi:hypothetical protein
LLPNSTDKLQPSDVGFFGPMKHYWRLVLQEHKAEDPNSNLLQKTLFPAKLKELISKIRVEAIIPKAFEKCGLSPVDRQKVLERIPSAEKSETIA